MVRLGTRPGEIDIAVLHVVSVRDGSTEARRGRSRRRCLVAGWRGCISSVERQNVGRLENEAVARIGIETVSKGTRSMVHYYILPINRVLGNNYVWQSLENACDVRVPVLIAPII